MYTVTFKSGREIFIPECIVESMVSAWGMGKLYNFQVWIDYSKENRGVKAIFSMSEVESITLMPVMGKVGSLAEEREAE
jgi:hypothetical protein